MNRKNLAAAGGRGAYRYAVSAPSRWLVLANLWIIYVIWGSTYLAMRIAVETIPPLLGAGVRFALAGLILAAFLALGLRVFVSCLRSVLFALAGFLVALLRAFIFRLAGRKMTCEG